MCKVLSTPTAAQTETFSNMLEEKERADKARRQRNRDRQRSGRIVYKNGVRMREVVKFGRTMLVRA